MAGESGLISSFTGTTVDEVAHTQPETIFFLCSSVISFKQSLNASFKPTHQCSAFCSARPGTGYSVGCSTSCIAINCP